MVLRRVVGEAQEFVFSGSVVKTEEKNMDRVLALLASVDVNLGSTSSSLGYIWTLEIPELVLDFYLT